MSSTIVNQPIKYLANGQLVRVLAQPAPDQIVVEIGRTYEDDFSEVFFEGTKVVKAVYDNPPLEAIHTDILKLEGRRSELRQSVLLLEETARTAQKRVDSLKVYDQLARIEDFLAGKITHYVIYDGYYDASIPRISTPETEKSGDETLRHAELKLLSLYGSKERTLEWKLNRYSDGSGSSSMCIPCCSLEEAQQKAREILAAAIAKYKVPEQNNCQTGLNLASAAKHLGVPLPDGFEEALRKCHVRNCESEVAKRQKELDASLATLRAAQGLASVGGT